MASLSIEPGSGESPKLVASNRSRVEGDKRTEGIEPRSYFPDASVDHTEARNARRLHPVCDGAGGEAPTAVDLDGPPETQATLQFRRAEARLTLTFAGEVQAEEAEGRR